MQASSTNQKVERKKECVRNDLVAALEKDLPKILLMYFGMLLRFGCSDA